MKWARLKEYEGYEHTTKPRALDEWLAVNERPVGAAES
jgi:hypothetical protein